MSLKQLLNRFGMGRIVVNKAHKANNPFLTDGELALAGRPLGDGQMIELPKSSEILSPSANSPDTDLKMCDLLCTKFKLKQVLLFELLLSLITALVTFQIHARLIDLRTSLSSSLFDLLKVTKLPRLVWPGVTV